MSIKKQPQRVHHISSHFTSGLFPTASVCITLFLFNGDRLFESVALFCCVMGAIAAPVVYVSGLLDWCIRLKKRPARIFARKRAVGLALVLISMLLIAFRLFLGVDLATAGQIKYIYAGAIYVLTGMATYLGYLGGKFIL
jgi:uncharacterized membrane protein